MLEDVFAATAGVRYRCVLNQALAMKHKLTSDSSSPASVPWIAEILVQVQHCYPMNALEVW